MEEENQNEQEGCIIECSCGSDKLLLQSYTQSCMNFICLTCWAQRSVKAILIEEVGLEEEGEEE